MRISAYKLLSAIEGMDLKYESQDQRNIVYFLKRGYPSQYYLKIICEMANINISEVQEDEPIQVKRSGNPTEHLTVEAYKSFGGRYKGD